MLSLIKYLIKDSTGITFAILVLFGLFLSVDSLMPNSEIIVDKTLAELGSKAGSSYSSYNNTVSTSKYYSTVLSFEGYNLLLPTQSEIDEIYLLLKKGEIKFNITPISGLVKSMEFDDGYWKYSANFKYVWGAYLAALFFIMLQMIIRHSGKVAEYLFAYISIFIMIYVLFFI